MKIKIPDYFVQYKTFNVEQDGTIYFLINKKNQHKPKPQEPPVVTTATPSLRRDAKNAVGRFETQCLVKGDESLRRFVGVKKTLEPEPEKEKTATLNQKLSTREILEINMETVATETSIEAEVKTEVKLRTGLNVCNDRTDLKGSWLRAVTVLIAEDGDLEHPASIHQMCKTLRENTPHLRETASWVNKLFGGDDAKFVKFVGDSFESEMMINLEDSKGMMLCMATARIIRRVINIHTLETIRGGTGKLTLDGGLDSGERKHFEILFHGNRFWALVPAGEETDEGSMEVPGMAPPSQTQEGKYRQHKKRGPTLPIHGKSTTSKAKRDEARRRNEKAKSELEVKIDALIETNDSLKADAGQLLDKLKAEQNRGKAMRKYIASLEIRFSDLCDSCKIKTPETAFSSAERCSIQHIVKLLEDQQEKLEALTKFKSDPAPVTGTEERDDSL